MRAPRVIRLLGPLRCVAYLLRDVRVCVRACCVCGVCVCLRVSVCVRTCEIVRELLGAC